MNIPPHMTSIKTDTRHQYTKKVLEAFDITDSDSNFGPPAKDLDYLWDADKKYSTHEVVLIEGPRGPGLACDCPFGMDAGECWHAAAATHYILMQAGGPEPTTQEEFAALIARWLKQSADWPTSIRNASKT